MQQLIRQLRMHPHDRMLLGRTCSPDVRMIWNAAWASHVPPQCAAVCYSGGSADGVFPSMQLWH